MQRLILFLVTGLLFVSCGSVKTTQEPKDLNVFTIKNVAKQNEDTRPQNEFVVAKLSARYETEKLSQNLVIRLRMQQDSVIWMSATLLGIQVAKVMMTPNSLQFYEKLGKTYYEGNYDAVSNILGVSIGFEELQRLLMGLPLIDLTQMRLSQIEDDNYYKLSPKEDLRGYLIYFLLDPTNFRLAQEELVSSNSDAFNAKIAYDGTLEVAGSEWPEKISFTSTDTSGKTLNLTIDYRRIEDKKKISFPYRVPSRYKKISW